MTQPYISGPPGAASFKYVTGAITTQIKTGAGSLHGVVVGIAAAGATVALYDGLNTSGTPIGVVDASTVRSAIFDCQYNTGLYMVVTGTPAVTVTYF
jgi:hypothetical protein